MLKDTAFALAMLTAIFAFYWRFVRPGVVGTVKWRTNIEAQVRDIRKDMDRHAKDDGAMLTCMKEMKDELMAINTKIAVLEERSKNWTK